MTLYRIMVVRGLCVCVFQVMFDKCFLGSSPVSSREKVFYGQMSAIYLIKEPLGKEVVQALFKLGPGYKVENKQNKQNNNNNK